MFPVAGSTSLFTSRHPSFRSSALVSVYPHRREAAERHLFSRAMNDRGVPFTQRAQQKRQQFPGGNSIGRGLPFSGSLISKHRPVSLTLQIPDLSSQSFAPTQHSSKSRSTVREERHMKLYAMLVLLAAVVASPCTVLVCRASRTVPPGCDPVALRPCAPAIWGQAPSAACCAKLREQKPCLCKCRKSPYLSKYINSPEVMKVVAACGLKGLRC